MLSQCISLLIIIILPLGMLSGLTASSTVPLFLIALIISYRKQLTFDFSLYKLELIFFTWCFICCFITPNPSRSLVTFVEVFTIISLGLLLSHNIDAKRSNTVNINKSLFIGIAIAIALFSIEYFSQGLAYKSFRKLFQADSPHIYQLHSLDRGCALLTLSSWVTIGILLNKRRYVFAISIYGIVLSILYLSDSLASFLGFILAGLLVILSKIISPKLFRLTTFMILVCSIMIPVIAVKIDPAALSNKLEKTLPDSAKHRLFIWHFVGEKAMSKPLVGWGFGASRQYEVIEREMINFNQYRWSPLPLHPHNNILQILFETGIIGLVLFLSLVFKYLSKIEDLIKTDTNIGCVSYACFVNYYVIGMISFSIWQAWWVAVGVWLAVMLKSAAQMSNLKEEQLMKISSVN